MADRNELTIKLRRLHEWASGIQRAFDPRITNPIRDSFKNVVAMFEDAIQAVARELEKVRGELNGTKMLVDESQRKLAVAVGERIQETNRRLAEKDKEWKNLVDEQRRSVDNSFTALRQEVASVAENAESAQRQYVVLNRKIRLIQAKGMKADIDDWAAGQVELGEAVADGREAARRLCDMTDDQEPAVRIKRYRDQDAAYQRHLRDAVTVARDLTTVDPTMSRKVLAGLLGQWADNRKEATRLTRVLPQAMADARLAQENLDVASQEKNNLEQRVERGKRAERALYEKIDAYLYPVLDGGLVLPIWLDLALGCGIVGRDWRDWLDTAIRLIHYRIVYRVPLGCDALGPRPTAEGRQATEYDRLRADCAAYHL